MTENDAPSTESTSLPSPTLLSKRSAPSRPSLWHRMLGTTGLMAGMIVILVILVVSYVLPPLLHLDPYAVDPVNRLAPPSAEHLFGTDNFGRDLFARIVSGASTSLLVGFVVALVSGVLGALIGVAAVFNRMLDSILMRICDGLMAIPAILLAVALAAALGPSVTNLIIALAIVYTPGIARLVRSRALASMSETFVTASRMQGGRMLHIMWRHILPNTLSVLVVQATFTFAESIITEAAMSFLGAGVPAPHASWGNILYDGKSVIMQAPQMILITSAFLIVTVLALNLIGDGLRDLVDQRSQALVSKPGIFARLAATVTPSRFRGRDLR
ncbi:ABC transporter permease [Glaciibacter psychrotolerans]|uniref:Peptide/nickel transport system permease protein n=1 Tax=Glaciibacter psychrotolerans TaxID=670054 RepID=A0A7Z0EBG4_9MICO|nr:ABC transporter permease [Leifsonia psychrotolerans]NYJ18582.1 peptide/nickel transport system permease protein [Leifsonia psychrotolerans]